MVEVLDAPVARKANPGMRARELSVELQRGKPEQANVIPPGQDNNDSFVIPHLGPGDATPMRAEYAAIDPKNKRDPYEAANRDWYEAKDVPADDRRQTMLHRQANAILYQLSTDGGDGEGVEVNNSTRRSYVPPAYFDPGALEEARGIAVNNGVRLMQYNGERKGWTAKKEDGKKLSTLLNGADYT